MSRLIQMRQRIKAIETIKKITHAMRLISMSAHSRMRNQQDPLDVYMNSINRIFATIAPLAPKWQNPIIHPQKSEKAHPLIIVIGSQKGLCGNFNTALFYSFENEMDKQAYPNYNILVVGKKISDFIKEVTPKSILKSYEEFSIRSLPFIAKEISDAILNASEPYSSVIILSNKMHTFFIQKPTTYTLIPFSTENNNPQTQPPKEGYIWEHKPEEILDLLAQQYIEARIHYLLFQSLLAEHAARFISMDNATRNAKNLLEETELQYNKLRQAKITKELTELSSSL